MSATVIVLLAAVAAIIAWFTWGRYVARALQLSDERPTPAHTMRDDVDYVPAKAPVLLGHHFASIAGASPIVGPILAIGFGWVPALIWIIFGGVFIGAVHDLVALTASVRHQGRTIGEVIEEYLGITGKRLFAVFAFAALILVVGVFTHVVAAGFADTPDAAAARATAIATGQEVHELDGPKVATTHSSFVVLAVLFGLLIYKLKMPLVPATILGVLAMFGCVALGIALPLHLPYEAWVYLILAYCVVASVLPVQMLLQPRDYLNSFLLYLMMLFGIGGLLYASISGAAPTTIEMHAFGAFVQPSGPMFPILFVTIACGAISGFHSLVASGTTSKQLDKESDAKVVGYGGMLIEVCLAALSLAVVASMSPDVFARHSAGGVINVFQQGLGTFIATLGIPMSFATTFVGLSISAFALTSLDTCTRLARFIWQEFFEVRRHTHAGAADDRVEMAEPKNTLLGHSMAGRITGTLVPVVCGGALTLSGQWKVIWPLFGAANQMLGALALMAAAVWLSRKGMKTMYVIVPMVLMFAITLTALGVLFVSNLRGALAAADDAAMKALPGQYLLCGLSLVLFALSVVLLVRAVMALRGGRETPAPAASVVAPT